MNGLQTIKLGTIKRGCVSMSGGMRRYILDYFCLQFGFFNPRGHTCIRGLEAGASYCLLCKRISARGLPVCG